MGDKMKSQHIFYIAAEKKTLPIDANISESVNVGIKTLKMTLYRNLHFMIMIFSSLIFLFCLCVWIVILFLCHKWSLFHYGIAFVFYGHRHIDECVIKVFTTGSLRLLLSPDSNMILLLFPFWWNVWFYWHQIFFVSFPFVQRNHSHNTILSKYLKIILCHNNAPHSNILKCDT